MASLMLLHGRHFLRVFGLWLFLIILLRRLILLLRGLINRRWGSRLIPLLIGFILRLIRLFSWLVRLIGLLVWWLRRLVRRHGISHVTGTEYAWEHGPKDDGQGDQHNYAHHKP